MAFSYSLDDSSGESLGDGFDPGAVDLTGGDYFGDSFGDDTLQGSPIDLGGDGETGSIFDGASLSLDDQYSLSGSTEAAPSWFFDSGEWDSNGAGSAPTVHPASISSPGELSTIFSGLGKFGASIGQLFIRGSAPTAPMYAGAPANANPNRTLVHGLSSGNALLLVVLVVGVGAFVVMGGKN